MSLLEASVSCSSPFEPTVDESKGNVMQLGIYIAPLQNQTKSESRHMHHSRLLHRIRQHQILLSGNRDKCTGSSGTIYPRTLRGVHSAGSNRKFIPVYCSKKNQDKMLGRNTIYADVRGYNRRPKRDQGPAELG